MNPFEMMKQMKNMQSEMKKMRSELEAQVVTGQSSRGAVVVELTGAMQVKQIKLDPRFLEKLDVAQLEKWISEAMNSALEKAQKLAASQVSRLTGGMNPFA